MCFGSSDRSRLYHLQQSCLLWFCLDAEVAADACFSQHGNCRKTLFNHRCSSRYIMKWQNDTVTVHIKRLELSVLGIIALHFLVAEINPVGPFSALEVGSFQWRPKSPTTHWEMEAYATRQLWTLKTTTLQTWAWCLPAPSVATTW